MNMKDYGGPAFPTEYVKHVQQEIGNNVAITEHSPGMTLRDYFAPKAMAATICSLGKEFTNEPHADVSSDAYKWADAMLAARSAI